MSFFSGVKQACRRWLRIFLYLFLLTLPFNFQAFIAGVLFAKYINDGVGTGIELWTRELESFSWMDQWSVPGAPSIWDHQDESNAFRVPQLRSQTWASKLGITIPYSHQENFDLEAPIDRMIAFDGAVRDVRARGEMPTEYWVFVSRLAMPSVFEWDAAFVRLLEYHEMHPLPATSRFAYVDCVATPFLCHIWQVYYPALMHFRVDSNGSVEDDVDPEAFASPLHRLRPLEVRIFDLGLQLDVSPLPPGAFPTEFDQMKALTTQPDAYTIEEPYEQVARSYHRFNELSYFPACNRQGSFLDYTSDFDNFLLKRIATPIGLKGPMEAMNGVAFTSSIVVGTLFYWVANPIVGFWQGFFGQPTELDRLAERMEEREAFKQGGGLMGDAAFGFMDWMEGQMEGSKADSAEPPAVTTDKDEMKNLFAGLKFNVSKIVGAA